MSSAASSPTLHTVRPAPRPDTARFRWARTVVSVLTAGVLAVSVSACEAPSSSSTPTNNSPSSSPSIPTMEEDDGFTTLPLHFVSLAGQYPPHINGWQIGCTDLLVPITTVPVETEDPVEASMAFLLNDQQYRHGQPALTNSVLFSADSLTYVDHQVHDDTVEVNFSGSVVTRSACESYRIRAQLNATAASAAGVSEARILVDGVDLDQILGLEPFDRGEPYYSGTR